MAALRNNMHIVFAFFAVFMAFLLSNAGFSHVYQAIHMTKLGLVLGDAVFKKELYHWVNEGLMAIFFFVMVLEIRAERMHGALKHISVAVCPIIGALGGVIVPASIFYLLCGHSVNMVNGWAIPTATDIVFALAVFDLLVKPKDPAIKIMRLFLLSIAVVDDVMGICIIAIYYTESIYHYYLFLTLSVALLMFVMRLLNVKNHVFYAFCGVMAWFFVLYSGVHATMAGVLVGVFMPFESGEQIHRLKDKMTPLINYLIIPIFAFFNAGVNLAGVDLFNFHILTMAIMLGLVVGKPIGIGLSMYGFSKAKLIKLPNELQLFELILIGILSGVGFTVSLFIGSLSYEADSVFDVYMKLGILYGSLLSAVLGFIWYYCGVKYVRKD